MRFGPAPLRDPRFGDEDRRGRRRGGRHPGRPTRTDRYTGGVSTAGREGSVPPNRLRRTLHPRWQRRGPFRSPALFLFRWGCEKNVLLTELESRDCALGGLNRTVKPLHLSKRPKEKKDASFLSLLPCPSKIGVLYVC